MKDVIVIKTFSIKLIAWVCLLIFLLCTIGSIYDHQPEISPIFIIFSLIGAFMLLLSGEAEISFDGFKVSIPIGTYYISWDEVEYIETGAGNLVLGGGIKRLCFPSLEYWSGKDKIEAIEILASIIEKKDIEIKETKRAIIPSYKNTRVREMK